MKNEFVDPATLEPAEGVTVDPNKVAVDDYEEIANLVYPRYVAAMKTFQAFDFDDLICEVANLWRRRADILELTRRVAHQRIFLICEGERLLGEMGYQVDPGHLLKKAPGTAWIGITIGEADGRGRGIGFQALQWLEREIAAQGLARIELGVFEFNLAAQALYQRLGYQEIGRIDEFTYWDGLMWQDIRMEKYLAGDVR